MHTGLPKPQESLECPELHDFFKKVTIPSVRDSQGKLCDDHKQSAKVFASALASFFSVEPDGPQPRITPTRSPVELSTISLSADDIENHFLDLKTSSAPGPDRLTAFVLKNCA
ncbi:hypothetical protein HHI36_006725 [Cryptolaemus montrouzieri]|uniref:Uncharacterized protein n=1 Tax=Cryptolaemus montrouzieri TaxID=559131 RepID=A0ABD2NYZ2_9CUCU